MSASAVIVGCQNVSSAPTGEWQDAVGDQHLVLVARTDGDAGGLRAGQARNRLDDLAEVRGPAVKIGIVVGSTRPGRKGTAVGRWVHEAARAREAADYELIEIAAYDLPLLDEALDAGAANRQYEREATRVWSRKVDELDGFVWVTPEYNHGVPAAMKNAVDLLYPEWANKAVGFVGYGFDGGTRAVEQWRMILAATVMFTVRRQVSLLNFGDWDGAEFKPLDRRAGELSRLLDQLEKTTAAVSTLRS